MHESPERRVLERLHAQLQEEQCHRVPRWLLRHVLRCDHDIKAGEELLYHYGMSYWAKGADAKLAAERPDMLEAEAVLKDTWRQQVAAS